MTNDRYLVVSYFVCVALSALLGTLAFLFLRRPFDGVANAARSKRLASTLRRLFPVGLLFPALLGFLSVSYQSCGRSTYGEIVQNRGYLVQKNQQQISSTLDFIVDAVVVWNILVVLVLKSAQASRNEPSGRALPE